MNELLLWMSARGSGSQQSFRTKATELDAGRSRSIARHRTAAWDLSSLSHAEFHPSADGDGWRVAPAVLAAGDYKGPCCAILCGGRPPGLVELLLASAPPATIDVRAQASVPDRVELHAPSAAALEAAASAAGLPVQWNASLAVLAACTPPRDEVLAPIPMPLGGWTVERFSRSRAGWVPSTAAEARDTRRGLFRFSAEQQASVHVMMEDGAPHGCDAASGKFRVLGRRDRVMSYDYSSHELSIRISSRPPPLVQRALVVCSGELPRLLASHLVYSRIDRTTAAAAASLLGQRLS